MRTEDYLFPKGIYPEYWFYWDRLQFSGTDVFEFYVGELYRSRLTRWNPGSEFVREEGLLPFLPAIRAAMSDFDPYGDNRLRRDQLYILLDQLEQFGKEVAAASSVSDLDPKMQVSAHGHDFARKRLLLLAMAEDFRNLCRSALKYRVPLWILGL